MSLWDNIRGLFYPRSPTLDERALTPAQVWGSGGIWRPLTAAGVPVDAASAMKAAQGACVRLLADDIAGLPVDVYRKVGGRPQAVAPPDWVTAPSGNRWYLWNNYVSELVTSLLTDGNAFVRCFPNTFSPTVLQVLDPTTVVIEAPGRYRVAGSLLLGDDEIMHIPWVTLPGELRGISVVEAAEDTTGLELAAKQWEGAFFRHGATLGGIVKVPGGPETVDAKALAESFEARHAGNDNHWKPAVLTGGADFSPDTITPKEADLEPLWRHLLEEAARIYHIPPHKLASQQPGAQAYASVEQKAIEYVQHSVVNVTTRIERPHSLLLPGADTYLKLNTNALLRGDITARSQYYGLMLQNKVMTRDEVREKEDLPYMGELGWLETPNNTGDQPVDEPQRSLGLTVEASVAEQQLRAWSDAQAETLALMREAAQATQDATNGLTKRVADVEAAVKAPPPVDTTPSHRQVVRDADGRIVGVIERRGDQTWRQVIERDERGRVVSIKQVAA